MPNNKRRDRDDRTERYGGGQSGYGSGRFGDDRAMGSGFRNQTRDDRRHDDHQGVHTDDRFTGRGGQGYWEDHREPADEYNRGRDEGYGPAMRRDIGMRMTGGMVGQEPVAQTHRGKGPLGYTRSDDRIREDVNEALTDDDHVDATHIEVVVHDGEVTLTGTAEDRRQKRLAEDVTERISGVRDVHNHLRIRGNPTHGDAVGRTETETSPMEKKHRA